jgi:predicted DNA-binding transcriptional regulator AlpA
MLSRPALSPRDVSLPRFAVRREEAAASVGVSATRFDEWVKDGRMPPGRKIDGVVLWDVGEIREAWERLRDGHHSNNPFDGVVA